MDFLSGSGGFGERRLSPPAADPATGGTPSAIGAPDRCGGSGGSAGSEGAATLRLERFSFARQVARRRGVPTLQVADRDAGERRKPFVLVVQARDVAELLATCSDERSARLVIDLLERLEAIGREAGAEDVDACDAASSERDQRRLGVRLQPFGAAE